MEEKRGPDGWLIKTGLVEEVARAIYDDHKKSDPDTENNDWLTEEEWMRDDYRDHAKAAIDCLKKKGLLRKELRDG